MVKQANKRVMAKILSLVMILSMVLGSLLGLATTTYAENRTMNDLQKVMLSVLAMNSTQQNQAIGLLQSVSNNTKTIAAATTEMGTLIGTAMDAEDIQQAFQTFMQFSESQRIKIYGALLLFVQVDITTIATPASDSVLTPLVKEINELVTGDPNNKLGLQFLVRTFDVLATNIGVKIVTDSKSDIKKFAINPLDKYSNYRDNIDPIITTVIDLPTTDKSFLGLVAYAESKVNSKSDRVIRTFKQYLKEQLGATAVDFPSLSSKWDQAAPAAPVASSIARTSVVLTSDAGSMITCNNLTQASGSTWAGLNAGTTYSGIVAYFPDDDDFNRSPDSAAMSFKTDSSGGGGGSGGSTNPTSAPAATTAPTSAPVATTAPTSAPAATTAPTNPEVVKAVDTLKEATSQLDKITNPTEAVAKAQEIIKTTADVIKTTEASGQSAQVVKEAVVQVAEKVMAKVNEEKVEAKVDGAKATVAIQATDVQKYIEKVNTIAATATELNKQLADVSKDIKVESVLVVKVDTKPEVKEVQAEVPAALLKAAQDKALDKVAIDTGVAKIAVAPDSIPAGDAASVTLGAKVIDNADLTQEVKNKVGDAPVFDFNASAGGNKVSKFNKPVEISIPYEPKAGEDTKKLTVFYINDKGQLENVIGDYDAATKSVKFTTSHFSQYVVKLNDVKFNDIANITWAADNIEVMAAKGIINGVGDGQFDPEANITRAQFAAMVARAYKLTDTAASVKFKDIKDSDWFADEVYAAAKAGLIKGNEDGSFAPEESITRQDMAVIMARALDQLKGKSLDASNAAVSKYADKDSIASYATTAIDACLRLSIMKGMSDTEFAPEEQATRAQVAVILYRMFYLK